jgi:hypothetical protein
MKTTVKLGKGKALIVKPSPRGVAIELTVAGVVIVSDHLTPDQCGAFMFGLEQALEVGQIAADRAASMFNAPDAPTPFPALGGDRTCPPCNHDCDQSDTCPARSSGVTQAEALEGLARLPVLTLEQLQARAAA